ANRCKGFRVFPSIKSTPLSAKLSPVGCKCHHPLCPRLSLPGQQLKVACQGGARPGSVYSDAEDSSSADEGSGFSSLGFFFWRSSSSCCCMAASLPGQRVH